MDETKKGCDVLFEFWGSPLSGKTSILTSMACLLRAQEGLGQTTKINCSAKVQADIERADGGQEVMRTDLRAEDVTPSAKAVAIHDQDEWVSWYASAGHDRTMHASDGKLVLVVSRAGEFNAFIARKNSAALAERLKTNPTVHALFVINPFECELELCERAIRSHFTRNLSTTRIPNAKPFVSKGHELWLAAFKIAVDRVLGHDTGTTLVREFMTRVEKFHALDAIGWDSDSGTFIVNASSTPCQVANQSLTQLLSERVSRTSWERRSMAEALSDPSLAPRIRIAFTYSDVKLPKTEFPRLTNNDVKAAISRTFAVDMINRTPETLFGSATREHGDDAIGLRWIAHPPKTAKLAQDVLNHILATCQPAPARSAPPSPPSTPSAIVAIALLTMIALAVVVACVTWMVLL